MSGGKNLVLYACRVLLAALPLSVASPVLAAEPEGGPTYWLEAIVRVHTEIPAEARTAAYLGTERHGSGVVIDDAGLVVTIGYLITEAMGAEVTTGAGRVSRADVVGFDIASGLGLLRAAEPLAVKPLLIGAATALSEKTPVVVAGFSGPSMCSLRSWCRDEPSPVTGNTCLKTPSSRPRPTPAGAVPLCSAPTASLPESVR